MFSDTHPKHLFRYCPQCGSDNFYFDEPKKFVCRNCRIHYYINPAPAVAAILELPDGNIILTRRKFDPRKDTFDLPGGFVDCNESAEDAVRREVKEELNIEVNQMHFLVSFPNQYVFGGITYFTCDLAFICPIDSVNKIKADDDVSEAIVIKPELINFEHISFPSISKILKTYMQHHEN